VDLLNPQARFVILKTKLTNHIAHMLFLDQPNLVYINQITNHKSVISLEITWGMREINFKQVRLNHF
jgi:hypothetical protein